ncbi:MAG: beta-propeller domain-containing protein [Eubacteriales bacterium]|nr:beta-propeller domain-containing protein [Eubacteriales bacterium]MDD4716880.1 beta-propeller domain-containing protein [Eubacteriales bacterium]
MSFIKYKLLAVMLSVSLVASMIAACSNSLNNDVQASELTTFKTYDQITKMLQSNMSKDNGTYGMWRNMLGAEKAAQATADMAEGDFNGGDENTPSSGKTDDYSKTNLQVEGVDEADIIKTDGEYLYIIANSRFIIADIRNAADIKIVSDILYNDGSNGAENRSYPVDLFLDDENDIATIIMYSYDGRMMEAFAQAAGAPEPSGSKPAIDYYGYWGEQNVSAQVFDVSDPSDPKMTRQFSQEGNLISTRRIGDFVYLITSKYIYFYTDNEGKSLDELVIPAVKDSAEKNEWEMIPVDSILAIGDSEYSSFIVVTAIDTTDTTETVSAKAVLGGGHNVYASTESIYITSTRYMYDAVVNDGSAVAGGNAKDDVVIVEGSQNQSDEIRETDTAVKWQIFDPPVYEVFTDIYRFAINKGEIDHDSSGSVPGYALNQFAMDEYEGYFRVATTTGEMWRTDEFTSMNNLYILDDELKIKGKIEGLAATESIKSVRFLGSKAYMVTFRTTDPLFVLDLSDPEAPEVKGELKIPGYSEYLHPVSDNILLGFGKSAVEVDGAAADNGFKVSVFDVSDMSDPKEISTMIIGDRGTYSDVSYNHKALLFSVEKNIIGFPITIYEVPDNRKEDVWSYGLPVFSGYMILGLTEDNKLIEKARIAHIEFEIPEGYPYDGELKNDDWVKYEKIYSNSYIYAVRRGAFVGDTLFTVSDKLIKSNALSDFKDIGEVEMPGFTEMYSQFFTDYSPERG